MGRSRGASKGRLSDGPLETDFKQQEKVNDLTLERDKERIKTLKKRGESYRDFIDSFELPSKFSSRLLVDGSKHKIKNKKNFQANIQTKRFYIPEEGRWVRLKVSTRAIRSVTKHGVRKYLKKQGVSI